MNISAIPFNTKSNARQSLPHFDTKLPEYFHSTKLKWPKLDINHIPENKSHSLLYKIVPTIAFLHELFDCLKKGTMRYMQMLRVIRHSQLIKHYCHLYIQIPFYEVIIDLECLVFPMAMCNGKQHYRVSSRARSHWIVTFRVKVFEQIKRSSHWLS